MTNNLKVGDKFLLPVTISNPPSELQYAYAKNPSVGEVPIYPNDIPTLIPASTITDLQAENDRLKTALASIVEHIERPDNWDIDIWDVYRIAVKALGGE